METVELHKITHQQSGTDEISVAGLLGELAGEQKTSWVKIAGKPTTFTPGPHFTSHQDNGQDEISVSGLSGRLADPQPTTWDLIKNKPATFPPSPHAASHQDGGTDEISIEGLSGQPSPIPVPQPTPVVPESVVLTITGYPKWWNEEGMAKISLTSPGSQFVISARADYQLYIATIVLTVSGECNITLSFGAAGSSGPMDFGGTDEPRAIVIAMGNSPAPCGTGSFMVTAESEDPVSIGGFISYYLWKKPK